MHTEVTGCVHTQASRCMHIEGVNQCMCGCVHTQASRCMHTEGVNRACIQKASINACAGACIQKGWYCNARAGIAIQRLVQVQRLVVQRLVQGPVQVACIRKGSMCNTGAMAAHAHTRADMAIQGSVQGLLLQSRAMQYTLQGRAVLYTSRTSRPSSSPRFSVDRCKSSRCLPFRLAFEQHACGRTNSELESEQ